MSVQKWKIINWLSVEESKSNEFKFSVKILKYNYDKNLRIEFNLIDLFSLLRLFNSVHIDSLIFSKLCR